MFTTDDNLLTISVVCEIETVRRHDNNTPGNSYSSVRCSVHAERF